MEGTNLNTTRRNLANKIKEAKSGKTSKAAVKYYGGWEGGNAGTFGRAPTGRGDAKDGRLPDRSRSSPLGPSQISNSQNIPSHSSSLPGRRLKIRPNSAGAKSAWDTDSGHVLPKANKGTSPCIPPRPCSALATTRRARKTIPSAECAIDNETLSLRPSSKYASKASGISRNPGSNTNKKGPAAFANPFETSPVPNDLRDPASILNALQSGLTRDSSQAVGFDSSYTSASLKPPVSPPHEHVTMPHLVHPPATQHQHFGQIDLEGSSDMIAEDAADGCVRDDNNGIEDPPSASLKAPLAPIIEEQTTGGAGASL